MIKSGRSIVQTLTVFGLLLAFAILIWRPVSLAQIVKEPIDDGAVKGEKISPQGDERSGVYALDAEKMGFLIAKDLQIGSEPESMAPGTDQGEESEPNDTLGTADALTGTDGRIRGFAVPGTPDVDYFSFTAAAGDRVYAAVMTAFSPSTNSLLDLRDSTDAVVETDLDDGQFSTSSSSIAGRLIVTPGTYYWRVRENGTSTIRPYYLYFAIRSGSPTAEVEPNNTTATATALPASGWVSGTRDPASDADFFSLTLNAGDTVYLGLDIDPERDNTQWNARLGFGLFGTANNQVLVVDDASVGSVANPLSEAFFFTVKDAGTYFAYVDSAAAATASPTFTYNLNVSVIPAVPVSGCTTYTNSTPTPIADLAMSSSSITVPATANRITDVEVFLDATHAFMSDVDWHLRSPNANDNGIISDVGNATVGGPQTTMNWWIDDEAAIPPSFTLSATMRHMPEAVYRLDWFDGENPSGVWTLDMRDDDSGDTGTLNSWSLRICEDTPPPAGTQTIYMEDFEASDGGYTHSGTLDEWEYGLPNTAATNVAPARASFLNCNSGVYCWKTDLDATYELNSTMNLVSPSIAISAGSTDVRLSWAMRYQMENATFDHAWVDVTEVGNPSNTKRIWQWYGGTMSEGVGNPTVQIGESAGWGIYSGDITSFAGTNVNVTFHVDGDNSLNYPGVAIDDVKITRFAPAVPVTITGRLQSNAANGNRGIANAQVLLTEQDGTRNYSFSNSFGYFRFINILTNQNITIAPAAKRYTFNPSAFQLTGTTNVIITAN